ncbi:MAG: MBL fold metallo-hydrolase [Bacteroidota bacterium]|nr:MBL fold metallo-hydrolase [Bacteroidota bacterium]
MEIKQFQDKNLAHYSYAIVSNGEVAVIDPSRNPQPYYDFADEHHAKITTIIETHPHADFVSSHLEIFKTTGATIYVSKLLGAEYPHQTFDDDDAIILGHVTLKALDTPGHSPDSISIVLIDENDKERAVFSGDTLFIGDCGRPDLREQAGSITMTREDLAKNMYHSLHDKFLPLADDVMLYPAHGAGSLCGKGLSQQNTSTMGAEKLSNWSLQDMSEDDFVAQLLADQPFVPKYFPYEVGLNKKGAANFSDSISKVEKKKAENIDLQTSLDPSLVVIDSRPQQQFKKGHLKNAINLMNDNSFETWLGSIVNPGEKFYLVAENEIVLNELIARIAKIGYEGQIQLAISGDIGNVVTANFDSTELKNNEDAFTIVDIRNPSEIKTKKIFEHTIEIPLYELRERTKEIPLNKPIVVHCEAGFRSAAGSSIIKSKVNGTAQVFDLSEAVKSF